MSQNHSNKTSHKANNHKHKYSYTQMWSKLRLIRKCQLCRQSPNFLKQINKNLQHKYGSSQAYFYKIYINNLTNPTKKSTNSSLISQLVVDRSKEHIEKVYNQRQIVQQLPQLIQYYKYYSQTPVMFIWSLFSLLYNHQERKKIIQYNRLKILLSLDPTEQENLSERKEKSQKTSCIHKKKWTQGNILDEIKRQEYLENDQEESLMILNLRDKLSTYIGCDSHKKTVSIQQLDRKYKITSNPKKSKKNNQKQNTINNDLIKESKHKKKMFFQPHKNQDPNKVRKYHSCQAMNFKGTMLSSNNRSLKTKNNKKQISNHFASVQICGNTLDKPPKSHKQTLDKKKVSKKKNMQNNHKSIKFSDNIKQTHSKKNSNLKTDAQIKNTIEYMKNKIRSEKKKLLKSYLNSYQCQYFQYDHRKTK